MKSIIINLEIKVTSPDEEPGEQSEPGVWDWRRSASGLINIGNWFFSVRKHDLDFIRTKSRQYR